MTDKELRKLRRTDLLELLIAQAKENEALQGRLSDAEAQLHSRELAVSEAGSLAEAALRVNGVFEAAQAAAEQYLENLHLRSQKQETLLSRAEAESRAKAEQMLREAAQRCQEMEAEAKRNAEAYWAEISQRLDALYQERQGLRELLALLGSAPDGNGA